MQEWLPVTNNRWDSTKHLARTPAFCVGVSYCQSGTKRQCVNCKFCHLYLNVRRSRMCKRSKLGRNPFSPSFTVLQRQNGVLGCTKCLCWLHGFVLLFPWAAGVMLKEATKRRRQEIWKKHGTGNQQRFYQSPDIKEHAALTFVTLQRSQPLICLALIRCGWQPNTCACFLLDANNYVHVASRLSTVVRTIRPRIEIFSDDFAKEQTTGNHCPSRTSTFSFWFLRICEFLSNHANVFVGNCEDKCCRILPVILWAKISW